MSEQKEVTWLYHSKEPARIFTITAEQRVELMEQGWVDSPAELEAVYVEKPKVDDTPVDLSVEAQNLLALFVSKSEMTKDQLIELGKALNVEKLTRNMNEQTIANKIQEYLDGNSK